jgi:UDPglucose 6-dehydrogenase
VQLRAVEATLTVNEIRKRAMARKVADALDNELRGKTIAVLGLTFKPDTDDMREAPSIPLIADPLDLGAKVKTHAQDVQSAGFKYERYRAAMTPSA